MKQMRYAMAMRWLCIPLLGLTSACDSAVISKAKRAENDGNIIDNDMMTQMYPRSYRPGSPPYLERDYEAGADFICAEIKLKYRRDICSEPEINWK
ncbi:hypothetical protein V474_21420 [Novosphingobium barchaimii LL02]|uniref:Lipoprotein n=1 Tax=Novosphingobium barchaimii LL02 TaxID=1114963 RepID=A0A0J7XTS3_9SPHN|nr:hypothetical protein [Novosphingobium barchaimii]KMS54443.1 hypothetical protein V474_21420 [Novosphingobium barchaimii LL02]